MSDTPPPSPNDFGPDWKNVLAFVQEQQKQDRAFFDRWLKNGSWFLGGLAAAIIYAFTYLAGKSVDDAISKANSVMRSRIEEAITTDRVQAIVADVVKQKADGEIKKQVSEEVLKRLPLLNKEVSRQAELAAGRRIGPAAADSFRDLLKAEPVPARTVLLGIQEGPGSESENYAKQFQRIFVEAGWKEPRIKIVNGPPNFGPLDIVIHMGPGLPPGVIATGLTLMFRKPIEAIQDASLRENELLILIPIRRPE